MSSGPLPDRPNVIELRVDPRRDPGGRVLGAVLNAQFAVEEASRRRRLWTGVLAFSSLLCTLALILPRVATRELRIAHTLIWAVAAVAWMANGLRELVWARRLEALVRTAR